MNFSAGWLVLAALLVSACSSSPPRKPEAAHPAAIGHSAETPAQKDQGGYLPGDGPGADAPSNLMAIPDAVPRPEPLHRYANRPYTALGKKYTPLNSLGTYKARGRASWYGKKFHGRRTSSGEVYDMYGMTAAHPTLPLPSYARVTHLGNNTSVIVRVNDRGPFLHDRIIDLSYTAAHKLGIVGAGSGEVEVESLMADTGLESIPVTDAVHSEPLLPAAPPSIASTASTAALPTAPEPQGNIFLQLGAFSSQSSAESFLARMRTAFEGSGKQVELNSKDNLLRVHAGPYVTADEARRAAEKLQLRLGFKPFISSP